MSESALGRLFAWLRHDASCAVHADDELGTPVPCTCGLDAVKREVTALPPPGTIVRIGRNPEGGRISAWMLLDGHFLAVGGDAIASLELAQGESRTYELVLLPAGMAGRRPDDAPVTLPAEELPQ